MIGVSLSVVSSSGDQHTPATKRTRRMREASPKQRYNRQPFGDATRQMRESSSSKALLVGAAGLNSLTVQGMGCQAWLLSQR